MRGCVAAADEELVQRTKEVTRGGIDGCVDLVGMAATVNRAFQCAQKVHVWLEYYVTAMNG
jgi:Zn-dependent alcohol dehydrogenase